ncbi:MAG: kinesin motor protein cin8 [Candelina mexicana]|nr:MAG: kinesin motor protein cin8 [Candelina mexicana]
MASLPRPASGLPAKKHSMRPPIARPSTTRTQSSAQSLQGRSQSGTVSPAESVASVSTSRSRSPAAQNGGIKRKQRDFEQEGCEETNIHVVVRCRGRNDREVRENSGVVVSTEGTKGKSVELSMGPSALSNKTYNFDKVFSSAADQAMIFDDVVTPILDEVLAGYNCTIFAYGQTGTGKTYTMSGDMSDNQGLLSESAGIIPRVLQSLFSKLEVDDAESSVKCSFIELYNEELRDLLSVEENAKLKIFEDGNRKGHSATLVQGMEESHIKTAGAGIKLLQNGSYRRQVAATKCNDLSSRSHTVFTVTVYIKRTAEDGEDFVSAGKLNLVDLAGSENIQRSGAENKRAAEAGLINKSLLTLGRVINALVERSSHIPYRESKLTRLLQDSLGGRTKTCIIATVSPAKSNLEETISTLDYAFRAKNIRNKPQVNQTISKKTLLREFTAEIEKLKGELIATRQRNGIYLSNDAYEEMTGESESRRILSEEQKAKIETMETNLRNKVHELFSLTSNFNILKKDNEGTKAILDDTKGVLEKTEIVLRDTRQNLAEETTLRKAHQSTEEQLSTMGVDLITTVHKTVSDLGGLRSKIRRKSDLQSLNRENWTSSQGHVSDVTQLVEIRVGEFQRQQGQLMTSLSNKMEFFVQEELGKLEASQSYLQQKVDSFQGSEREVNDQTGRAKEEMNNVLEEIKVLREEVKRKVGEGLNGLSAAAARISAEVINELEGFHTQLHTSYSSLGRDFKNIFEELTKHLNSQKAEAENLREQLSVASTSAVQANAAASSQLETVLAEERQQAATDRQTLLSQITTLINTSGEAQDTRLTTKIASIQNGITASNAAFEAARSQYGGDMDVWSQKEKLLVGEVLKSRDTLKSKLKKDWMDANQHNSSIQTTTKSVHEETVRIVDAQMKDMAVQMQALDEFVTRARSQNERHHETHVQSLQGLSGTVRNSYTSIGEHFTSTYSRVRDLGDDMSERSAVLKATLPPLDATLRQPLADLRSNITDAPLKEYIPTGETPQKIQYSYPTTLPRTETHDTLIAKLKRSNQPSSSSTLPTKPEPQQQRKSVIFNDASLAPEGDDEIALVQPPEPSSRPTSSSGSLGLREVDVNVNAGVATSHNTINNNNSASNTNNIVDVSSMLISDSVIPKIEKPGLLKRHTTMTDSKLPSLLQKGAGRAGVVRAEGRENLPLGVGEGAGRGRRLRSSPNA